MSTHGDSRRSIAAWLEAEAPDRAPARLIEASRLRIGSTSQRRAWWPAQGGSGMNTFARLGVAAVAVASIGVVGLTILRGPVIGPVASPSPTESPSPSPSASLPALTERFDSAVHGISIDYPAGWQVRPATEPWTGGELSFDSPSADVIHDPALGDRVYLLLASQAYGEVMYETWEARVMQWLCAGYPGVGESYLDIPGARAWAVRCPAHLPAADHSLGNGGVFVHTDRRGYLIRAVVASDEPGLTERYGWEWLKSLLETVDLRPDEADDTVPDIPPATGSPDSTDTGSDTTRVDDEVLRFRPQSDPPTWRRG